MLASFAIRMTWPSVSSPARPARPTVFQKSRMLTWLLGPRQVSGTRTVLVGRFIPWDKVQVAHRTRSAPLR